MIISQLKGGLGNQLFQYAYGFCRAKELNVDFKIDIKFFDTYLDHEYSLLPFNISAKCAKDNEIRYILSLDKRISNKLSRKLFNKKNHLVTEDTFLFNSDYLTIQNNSYVMGYWQSEKYFKKYWDILSEEFRILLTPSLENKKIQNIINGDVNSVSLHIRRGDYVSNDEANKIHGTVSMEFYLKAMNMYASILEDPTFYIFSNDIDWVVDNLNTQHNLFFVDTNDDKSDFEDLRLMASCKHNIIANSTFSWWGAYLNSNPNKIVCVPERWFNDPFLNSQTGELLPCDWIQF